MLTQFTRSLAAILPLILGSFVFGCAEAEVADEGPTTKQCSVTFSVTSDEMIAALQFEADYSGVDGEFVGEAANVECSRLLDAIENTVTALNDHDAERFLSVAATLASEKEGPFDVARCEFQTELEDPEGMVFTIDVFGAANKDLEIYDPQPVVEVTEIECENVK